MKRGILCGVGLLILLMACITGCRSSVDPAGQATTAETVTATSHEHAFGEWQITQEATCTKAGEQQRRCTCGEMETAPTEALGHTEVIDQAVAATCTATGLTEGSHCAVCCAVLREQTPLPRAEHKATVVFRVEANCQNPGIIRTSCEVCHAEVSSQQIAIRPHSEVIDAAVPATCTATGLTEGTHCGACQQTLIPQTVTEPLEHVWANEAGETVTCIYSDEASALYCTRCGFKVNAGDELLSTIHSFENNRCTQCHIAEDFSDVSLYAGTWFYDYCATLEKGEAYRELYRRLDEAVSVFHATSAEVLSVTNSGFGIAVTVKYSDLGLNVDDLRLVRMFYHYDHPLYYWLSATFRHTKDYFSLFVFHEYIDSEVRRELTQNLYIKIAEIAESVAGVTSTYELALAYHDAVTRMMDYAYQEDGKTPVDSDEARWAYNIIGPFLMESGVCRGFADAYSLFLNYAGITNVITRGYTTVAHRWNQVLMDDGEWYWFDLTWDDAPETVHGIEYHYFCVSDTQEVAWKDQKENGSYSLGNGSTFFTRHTPDFDYEATNYVYDFPYPDCADEPYEDPDHLNLRDTFTADGLTYARIGYREVQLIRIDGSGTVIIPQQVEYRGAVYTVTAIGYMDTETRLMMQKTPVTARPCEIVIPKTVTYIGISALSEVKHVILDPENIAFALRDGGLYDVQSGRCLAKLAG